MQSVRALLPDGFHYGDKGQGNYCPDKLQIVGNQIRDPNSPRQVLNTRWLTQPCMFYDLNNKRCKVYELRPLVCRIYPLVFNDSSISLKVNCEYGKDLYKNIITEIRNKMCAPNENAAQPRDVPCE